MPNKFESSQQRDNNTNRMFGVGFGCDITLKNKNNVVYKFNQQIGNTSGPEYNQGFFASGGKSGKSTLAKNGSGNFQTIEIRKEGNSTRQQYLVQPHVTNSKSKQSKQAQEASINQTQITSTLHNTINESNTSPLKSPKIFNAKKLRLEKGDDHALSTTIQERG